MDIQVNQFDSAFQQIPKKICKATIRFLNENQYFAISGCGWTDNE